MEKPDRVGLLRAAGHERDQIEEVEARYLGMNVGQRPTFGDKPLLVKVADDREGGAAGQRGQDNPTHWNQERHRLEQERLPFKPHGPTHERDGFAE